MLRVVYIAGWLRSGTTLVCQSLGSVPGAVALGEVSGVWAAASRNEPCSCGFAIKTCPVWGPALDSVRVECGVGASDLDSVAALATHVLRTRDSHRLRRLGRYDSGADRPSSVRRYVELTGTLLRGAARAAGVSTVVDSSKLPPGFLTLGLDPGIKVDVVHLIRDPRAVVNSERRTATRTDVDPALLPPVRSALKSALLWSAANLAVRLHGSAAASYRVLRYEDFAAAPDANLSALCIQLGLARPVRSIGQGTGGLGHLAVGNPSRFHGSAQPITEDRAWEGQLPWAERALVTAVSRPVHSLLTISGHGGDG